MKDLLESMREDIVGLWELQSEQIELFQRLKDQDNDIDDKLVDEMIEAKREESKSYGKVIDRVDSILEELEEG